ncbi:MAG: hydrogenase maturation protease [Fischerella sp.]|uniref:hydrogenase maturation protease n=1 Tax=Fischerella sp. TaxID=1191 RepID=UPI0017FC88B6|nr:hydrogenase maturation protease [Fischerella sp.]NWF62319.1 hydrogenase maturation protease [Fischerella sp.]
MNKTILVIGYGNDLRSDDAIGQRVAEKFASKNLPYVKSLSIHHLTPELAEALASVDLVIFVDACLTSETSDVQVKSLLPTATNFLPSHTGDPQALLALTKAIYGYCPKAWWVIVPGENFELGDRLSPIAENGVAIALEKIADLIQKTHTIIH